MAKIRDSKPKNSSGGYMRLIENKLMSDLFTKIHSANIRNGNELEKIVFNKIKPVQNINNLDVFIEECRLKIITQGCFLCNKNIFNKSKYKLAKHQPDLLIFNCDINFNCYIIELKDGDDFDTKKSQSEKNSLIDLKNHLYYLINDIFINIYYKICCFNQNDKQKIIIGLKNKFNIDEVMTGRELCNMININYDQITCERKIDAEDNFNYIINEICKLVEVQNYVDRKQKEIVLENDFYLEHDYN